MTNLNMKEKRNEFWSKGLFTWSGGPRSSGVRFLLFSRSGGHKTKETYPTRPASPTPCKQGLSSKKMSPCRWPISIYTLSDLGDLSNLIGSLSRTIQQYSPPREWIMCELDVFPSF